MSNTFLKPDAILREAQRHLHNALPFIKNIDKQHDRDTTYSGQKRGPDLRIRMPNQYKVRTGWTIDVEEQNEKSVTLTIGTVKGVDMIFTDSDLALEINEFSERFIKPAANTLASNVDHLCFQDAYAATYNQVGTAGTVPNTAKVFLDAGAKMNEFVAPVNDRVAVVTPGAQANMVDGLKALFNNSKQISNQYLSGTMGNALGFDWFMSQNVPNHTCGTRTNTTPLVDGTVSGEGSTTIHMDGFASATATVTKGDIFTVAGVYGVNPETKQVSSSLQQFVATALLTCASNEGDVLVSPAMYTSVSGGLQNINAFPQDGAAVTFVGTASTAYGQNLCFHKEAHTFATASLEMPNDVSFKSQKSIDGINMRILRQFDINNSHYPCRLDVYFGFVTQMPQSSCRVTQ